MAGMPASSIGGDRGSGTRRAVGAFDECSTVTVPALNATTPAVPRPINVPSGRKPIGWADASGVPASGRKAPVRTAVVVGGPDPSQAPVDHATPPPGERDATTERK